MIATMSDRSTQTRAMASAQRLEILRLLRAPGERFGTQRSADPTEVGVCVSLLADALGVSQPTASRHIDLLRQAGFVTVRRRNKWSYCKRDEAALADYLDWLRADLAVP
jgi:DNA-binding transcriptional ArsR family regulator